MYCAFTPEVPRLFSLMRPYLALLTLGPPGPFSQAARIYTLPRGSARYIFITLNFPPTRQKILFQILGAPISKKHATLAQNRRSGLGSPTVPHGIAVLACDRRQFRTEFQFWPAIDATPARICRSCLGSSRAPHGMAALASDGMPRSSGSLPRALRGAADSPSGWPPQSPPRPGPAHVGGEFRD